LGGCFSFLIFLKLLKFLKFFNFLTLHCNQIRKDAGRQVWIVRLTGRFFLSVGMTRAGLGGCFSFLIFLKFLKFFNFLTLQSNPKRRGADRLRLCG
jgi:hypothetical protein